MTGPQAPLAPTSGEAADVEQATRTEPAADAEILLRIPCLASIIRRAAVPAQAAGAIITLQAIEGLQVEQDQIVGQIDERAAQAAVQAKAAEVDQVQEQVDNDIDVRFAAASAKVAQADYQQVLEANRKVPGAVIQSEVREKYLVWQKADLQTEQAQFEQAQAKLKLKSAQAELRAAEVDHDNRQLKAPFAGVVVEVLRQQGEWANAGDPVFTLVGLSELRVEGFVKAADIGPSEIEGRGVRVLIDLERGRTAAFDPPVRPSHSARRCVFPYTLSPLTR